MLDSPSLQPFVKGKILWRIVSLYLSSNKSHMRIYYFSCLIAVLTAGCNNSNTVKTATDSNDSGYVRNVNKKDVLVMNMDTTVDPSQDFFMYANGGWIRNNPIPAAYGNWGIGNLVVEENR